MQVIVNSYKNLKTTKYIIESDQMICQNLSQNCPNIYINSQMTLHNQGLSVSTVHLICERSDSKQRKHTEIFIVFL